MEQNTTKKVTRRIFNAIMAIGTFFGLKKSVEAKSKDEIEQELESTNYMEVLIIPEEYKYPYSHKTETVLANHLKAGKSRDEIKQFILSQCKIIKVPIK